MYTSASDRRLEAVVFESCAADVTVTTRTNGHYAQPGVWDRMIRRGMVRGWGQGLIWGRVRRACGRRLTEITVLRWETGMMARMPGGYDLLSR